MDRPKIFGILKGPFAKLSDLSKLQNNRIKPAEEVITEMEDEKRRVLEDRDSPESLKKERLMTPDQKREAIRELYTLAKKLKETPIRFKTILLNQKGAHYLGVFVEHLLFRMSGQHVRIDGFDLGREHGRWNKDIIQRELESKVRKADQEVSPFQGQPLQEPVLILTERIETGESLKIALEVLAKNNVQYWVITLSGLPSEDYLDPEDPTDDVYRGRLLFSTESNEAVKVMFPERGIPLKTVRGKAYSRPRNIEGSTIDYERMIRLADSIYALLQ